MISTVRRSLPALALAAALAVPAAASGGAAIGGVVVAKGMKFTPSVLIVRPGQAVEFEWKDGRIPHNVTSSQFRSSSTKTAGTYVAVFHARGTYHYHCTLHPSMTGEVVVR